MTISPVVRWCWVSTYLLLAAHATLSSAKPFKYDTEPKRFCGPLLGAELRNLCAVHRPLFYTELAPTTTEGSNEVNIRNKRELLTDECCTNPCSQAYLSSFCLVLKPQPKNTENQTSTSEMIFVDEPTTETSAPTDPTYRPEIAYDGEYSDQEPLTLLPTYTSPEYTNDLLTLRI